MFWLWVFAILGYISLMFMWNAVNRIENNLNSFKKEVLNELAIIQMGLGGREELLERWEKRQFRIIFKQAKDEAERRELESL